MALELTCPHCRAVGKAPDAAAGLQVTCKICHQEFVVPSDIARSGATREDPRPNMAGPILFVIFVLPIAALVAYLVFFRGGKPEVDGGKPEVDAGEVHKLVSKDVQPIDGIAWSPDGELLATAS